MHRRYKIARGLDGNRREETGNLSQKKRSPDGGSVDFGARRAVSHAMGENAMKSTSHNSKLKSSHATVPTAVDAPVSPSLPLRCGTFVDPSGRIEVTFPLKGGKATHRRITIENTSEGFLPLVPGKKPEPIPTYVSLEQAARLCGFKPKTFYNWIAKKKLRPEYGLRKFSGQYRIEWSVFAAAVARGLLGSCS